MFAGNTKIQTFPELSDALPNNIYSMVGAFSGCTGLRRVTLPDIKMETQGLFYNCSSLEFVVFPTGVNTIQFYAFNNNKALNFVVFTSSEPPRFENTNMLTTQKTIKLYVLDRNYDEYANTGWINDLYLNYGGDRLRRFSRLATDYPEYYEECVKLVSKYTGQ